MLAEQGDDISNLEVPKENENSAKQADKKPQPPQQESKPEATDDGAKAHHAPVSVHDIKHDKPLFPSVQRLLVENNIADTKDIKGTGVRGMITKGDVLAYLGKADAPAGDPTEKAAPAPEKPTKESKKRKDEYEVRMLPFGFRHP